jgi:hypothetical protein
MGMVGKRARTEYGIDQWIEEEDHKASAQGDGSRRCVLPQLLEPDRTRLTGLCHHLQKELQEHENRGKQTSTVGRRSKR